MRYVSTKIIPMGSTAFRQWRADSHCKLIHGYRLQCKLWFTADELDDKNWVFDFGGCREIIQKENLSETQSEITTNTAVIGNNITEVPVVKAAAEVKPVIEKPHPASGLYNKKSTGFGDPFAGTSWGNKS
mgnify:CR=1 FL=1